MKLNKQLEELLVDEVFSRFSDPNLPKEISDYMQEKSEEDIIRTIQGTLEATNKDHHLENIIHAFKRPAFLIQQNTFDASSSDTWNEILTSGSVKLKNAIPSIGRIEMKNHSFLEWAGTGFRISEEIIVTNRHVAYLFTETTPNGYSWKINSSGDNVEANIDFLGEYQNQDNVEMDILEILYIEPEPGPDLALFKVGSGDGYSPVKLSSLHDADDIVATVGYPWKDSRMSSGIERIMQRIFGGIYGYKRIAPGKILEVSDWTIRHDCTTLGGNSGSAVLDVETGEAVALHYSGDVTYNNAISASIISDRFSRL